MNIRNASLALGLAVAIAVPAIGQAQYYHPYRRVYGPSYSYGHGPFYPSYVPGPSYYYYGGGQPYSTGGLSFSFGNGGGYYGTYGNSYGRSRVGYRSYGGRGYGGYRGHSGRR